MDHFPYGCSWINQQSLTLRNNAYVKLKGIYFLKCPKKVATQYIERISDDLFKRTFSRVQHLQHSLRFCLNLYSDLVRIKRNVYFCLSNNIDYLFTASVRTSSWYICWSNHQIKEER